MRIRRSLVAGCCAALIAAACTSGAGTDTAAPTSTTTAPTTSEGGSTTTETTAPPQPEEETGARLVETVSVETPLGTMTWERYELDRLITHVAPYGDGYVGLIFEKLSHRPEYNAGRADPGVVATSPDGIEWTPLPEQPGEAGAFTPSVLNVVGDEIAVAGRALADGIIQPGPLLAFIHGGSVWSELTVEPAEGGYAAPGGSLDIGTVEGDSTRIRGGNSGTRPAGYWAGEGDGLSFATQPTHLWPIEWPRSDVVPVWPAAEGYTSPADIIGAMVQRDGRFVAVSWMGAGGTAWSSTDGAAWEEIDPIVAPWPGTADRIVTPEVVDAGGLGWLAVGSFGAPSVVWLSADGLTWVPLEGVTLGPTDLIVPWPPPSTVVDDRRILIYGRSPLTAATTDEQGYAISEPTPPTLWVGELASG